MPQYYKGIIKNAENIWGVSRSNLFKKYIISRVDKYKTKVYELTSPSEWNQTQKKEVNNTISDMVLRYCDESNETLLEISEPNYQAELNKEFFNSPELNSNPDFSQIEVIFEEFEDEYGNLYGKELITGLVFLLAVKSPKNLSISYGIEKRQSDKEVYRILYRITPKSESISEIKSIITKENIATEQEVLEYQNSFKGFKNRKRLQKFHNDVLEMYRENKYEREITPKKELPQIPSELLTTQVEVELLESIEYLLSVLKKHNQKLYEVYNEEYLNIISSGEDKLTNHPLDKVVLASLEAKIELALKYNKNNATNITEYLQNLKTTYLTNALSGESTKTEMDLKSLDRIVELFLAQSKDYSIITQRQVLRDIAFIYIMEVYENKDTITPEELQNSYFKKYLKTIMTILDSLVELGIIKNSILIDLGNKASTEEVLNIINSLEFNQFELSDIQEFGKKI